MTEQRRTASPLVALAFGLGILGLVLCVVPWTSASSRNEFIGAGSTAISKSSKQAPPHASRPADPAAPGRGVLVGRGKGPQAPTLLRNPYYSRSMGGDSMDWTHMPSFASRDFGVAVGDVLDLYPGHQLDLPVTFVNNQPDQILVETATVTATGSTACPSSNLLLSDVTFSTPIRVAGDSAVSHMLPFGLLASAPDGCQGARFVVTVTARATSA